MMNPAGSSSSTFHDEGRRQLRIGRAIGLRSSASSASSSFLSSVSMKTTAEEDPSSSDACGGIGAVAARIQDRAQQLFAAQTKLGLLKTQLERILEKEKKEVATNSKIRRDLLLSTNSRNGVELELYDARDKIDFYKRQIQQLNIDIQQLQEESDTVARRWEEDVNNVYSRHHHDMNVYKQSWELALQTKARDQAKRDDEITDIQSNINEMEDHTEMMRVESDQVRDEIAVLEQSRSVDGDVCDLSTKIQEALAQRAALRNTLKNEQKELNVANQNMLKWEEKCSALSASSFRSDGRGA